MRLDLAGRNSCAKVRIRRRLPVLSRPHALSIFLLLALVMAAAAALPPGTRYVMSHFKTDNGGGDERLYISVSPDALTWTALNGGNPVYQPVGWSGFNNVVRDPSIIYENGFYWVAHTSGNYGRHASFALLKSADLLAWTLVGEIGTLIPGATDPLTWSPTFFRDGDGTVHVYVAIRPDGGASYSPVPGMRVHELHPVNADWTQWSAPVLVDLPSTNTNEFWVWKEGALYHGIYVDFTRGGSPYVHVTSSAPVSGWGNPRELGFYGQEGGFVLKRPDGGYRVYTEGGNSAGGTYLYSDWNSTFTSATAQTLVQSTVPMRNGKVMAVPNGLSYADWSAAQLAGAPAASQAPEADPEHDGRANVLEFATGSDPLHSDREPALLPMSGGVVRYRRAAGAEATLALEVSPDLQGWYSGPAYTQELSVTLRTDGTEEVAASPLISGPQLFYRLRARLATVAPLTPKTAPLALTKAATLRRARPKPRRQLPRLDQLFLPRGQRLQFDQRPFVAE
jgi:hypothetical protein